MTDRRTGSSLTRKNNFPRSRQLDGHRCIYHKCSFSFLLIILFLPKLYFFRDGSDLSQSGMSIPPDGMGSPIDQQTCVDGMNAGGCSSLRGDVIESKPVLDNLGQVTHPLMHPPTDQMIHHPQTPPHSTRHPMHPQIGHAVGGCAHGMVMSSIHDQQRSLALQRSAVAHPGSYSIAGHTPGLLSHHHQQMTYSETSSHLTSHMNTSPSSLHSSLMQHNLQNTAVEMGS